MKQWRKDRFPAAWECEMVFRHAGRMRVEVRNVSETGMRLVTEHPVAKGEAARITVGGGRVQGLVTRVQGLQIAIAFDAALTALQLASLRQFRRLGARRIG